MTNKKKIAIGTIITTVIACTVKICGKAKKTTYIAEAVDEIPSRKMGFYEKYIKRILDIICALGAIVVFSPIYLVIALLVKLKLGSPVLFIQDRPGLIGKDGKETVFKMYKFRTMTDEKDKDGNLLPDEVRLTKFGKWLRSTSLDELPEAFNILNGTMSVIGPRPQLVRDMVFMTKEQRMRHTAKPGLSGLAQVNGRNAISWEDKLGWDLKYIENVSFVNDIKIVVDTVKKAFIKQEGITQKDMATAEDYGDYLLRVQKISEEKYYKYQRKAMKIVDKNKMDLDNGKETERISAVRNDAEKKKYSVLMSLYNKENPEYLRMALDSMLKQTIPPDEVVLVEDGPLTNELYDVLDEYPMIHRVKNKENLGLGLALNEGLKVCKNELVARMDTDDIAILNRCEKQVNYLEDHKEVSIVGGQISEFVKDIDNIIGKRIVPKSNVEIRKYMKKRCPFNHMTVMFRKSDVLRAGNYRHFIYNEDYDLWIRMMQENFVFANLADTLVYVRTTPDLYKRRGGLTYFKSEVEIQKQLLKLHIIGIVRFLLNVLIRLCIQILMPSSIRQLVFRIFARKKSEQI